MLVESHVASFLEHCSLEATLPKLSELEAVAEILPGNSLIYVSAVPGRSVDILIESCSLVRSVGFEPVPHIAARNYESKAALGDALARLTGEIGVRKALIIAGDRDESAGPFSSALDVLGSGELQRHGIRDVGISGYPEGHPRIGTEALEASMAAKLAAAKRGGLNVHIVTQFSFNANAIAELISDLRSNGVFVPIRIGIAGPVNAASLLRYANRCGVRTSVSAITRNTRSLFGLVNAATPDALVEQLAERNATEHFGAVFAHFYSFGGIANTAHWIRMATRPVEAMVLSR